MNHQRHSIVLGANGITPTGRGVHFSHFVGQRHSLADHGGFLLTNFERGICFRDPTAVILDGQIAGSIAHDDIHDPAFRWLVQMLLRCPLSIDDQGESHNTAEDDSYQDAHAVVPFMLCVISLFSRR